MRTRLEKLSDWVAGVEPIKAFVVSILATAFIAGVTYKGIDNRIENNASDLKVEQVARESGDKSVTVRIDRGFDKILNRMDGIQHTLDDRAKADAQTAHEMGLLRGLYERNYGEIPKDGKP